MLRSEKVTIVAELTEQLQGSETLFVADYRGLTMPQIDELRDELFKQGARFTVAKNTLARLAAQSAGADALLELLEGPTAIAFVPAGGDPVPVAKALSESARTTKILVIRGGVLQGKAIGEEAVKSLATLPSVDVLRAQALGAMTAPLTSFLALISAPLQNLIGLIDARIEQLGGAAAPETAPAAPTEAPAAEAAAPADASAAAAAAPAEAAGDEATAEAPTAEAAAPAEDEAAADEPTPAEPAAEAAAPEAEGAAPEAEAAAPAEPAAEAAAPEAEAAAPTEPAAAADGASTDTETNEKES